MAALILPSRRTSQPQGPVSFDRANWLGRRAIVSYYRGQIISAINRAIKPTTGTFALGASADGLFTSFDGSTRMDISSGWFYDGTVPVTFAWYSRTGASPSAYSGVFNVFTAASKSFVVLRGTGSYGITVGSCSASSPQSLWNSTIAANTTERIVVTCPSGMDAASPLDQFAWINKTKLTPGTGITFSGSSNNTIGWDGADSNWSGLLDEVTVFRGVLTDDEIFSYYENPYQLYVQPSRRIYFNSIAAGGNVNITPPQGSVVITGNAPVLATSFIPTAGSIAITGYAPSIVQTTAITPGVGSVTVSGAAGLLNIGVIPTAGSVAITGYAPTVNTSGSSQITPSVGSVTIAGYAPITNLGTVVPSGSVALSGYSPSVVQSILITPGSGSISITGYAPTLTATANVNITPDPGSVGITGYSPTITGIAIVSAAPSVGAGKATRDRSAKRQKFIARIDGEDFVVNSPAEAEALINQAREKAAELARVRASEIVAKRKAKANKGSLLNTKPLTIDIPQVDIRKGDRFSEAANLFRQQLQAEIDNAFSQAARDAEISLLMHLHKQLDDEAAIVALLF